MNLKRMLNLLDSMRNAKEDEFDMNVFTHSCGTPACALGNYGTRKDQNAFWYDTGYSRPRFCYAGEDPFAIASQHFGIKHSEAEALFGGNKFYTGDYATRATTKDVMVGLTQFIAKKLREETKRAKAKK